ncbi:hypothetical protein [Streptomyces sp. NPDC086766]|uniref:hypothetical protein n=1 Tax=Streptomyces sp. NPDC086766 TaxID=3365754 RepID=UPI0037FCA9A2
MEHQAATEAASQRTVGTSSVFYSFAPWIIFGVVAGPSTWEYAALAALVAAIGLSGRDFASGRFHLLDMTGIAFFAVLAVLALALDRQQLYGVEEYAQVISNGVVALVALASLFFDPFTAQYARQSTPPHLWHSPIFRHVNIVLTATWGAVFAAMALLSWLALRVPSAADWLNWVLPVVLLIWAIKFTQRYPGAYRGRALADQSPTPS